MFTPIDVACLALGLASAMIAAVIDYRTLRIPNALTFPMILAGLILMAARCLAWYPLHHALITCVLSYVFVYGLWKCRLWGGGDAKLVLALLLLVSPAWPLLYYLAAFSACLALVLLLKHGIYRPFLRRAPVSKGGPLSAEDIASLKEQPGEPMGPSLLVAFASSIVLLEAVVW